MKILWKCLMCQEIWNNDKGPICPKCGERQHKCIYYEEKINDPN